ncbi:hypothetical protein CVT25_008243 [Psilocybe cyanescens]|uniref:NudC domain-containing protein 1 n=1 Tax=Psilocybe cyanescens TaxID=93625 RepID=A0A409X6T8_PSICY|nr:hypothetical protein CVT25_008243 [Psilocybe cyanescens]
MDTFRANRSLLNPKFEGYKLEPIHQEQAVSRFKLSRKPTQATASGKAPLTFQEMRSRISHNHLSVDSDSGRAIYVDEEFNVCLIGIPMPGGVTGPSFQIVYQMATPMDTSSAQAIQREYPSAVFLSSTTVVVTDGNGLLYILPIRDNEVSEPIGIFTVPTGGAVDAPFRLHNLYRSSPITAILLLSSRHYGSEDRKSNTNSSGATNYSPEFDIWAVKINILSLRPGSEPRELEVLWHRRGQDVPILTDFVEQVNSFLILGGSTYPDPNAKPPTKPYEPTSDEIAPIPRANENLDAAHANPNESDSNKPPKPHPYSWTQTSDSVTVAFPLPSNTPKNKIKVLFTVQTLTLHVDTYPLESSDSPPVPIPHHSAKALWDSVNTTSCFWTWDREAEHAYGLLTLHMEKKNEGTRWMQVFAAAASSLAGDEENPEVPETVDPSELWHIRESLEKYTAALKSGGDTSGLGLGRGVPSLIEGEVDEEADAVVGRKVWATWVDINGQTPIWTRESSTQREKDEWEDEPFTLLSTPMPGSVSSLADLQLILKQDVDGTVFSLVPSNAAPEFSWQHTSTYCALAFVLASKQDTRFTYHVPKRGVLAFEGGSQRDRGANVYIYRPAKSAKDKWAKQSVLQVDNGSGGALLGVGYVKVQGGTEGEMVVVCLTEGELVLISDI